MSKIPEIEFIEKSHIKKTVPKLTSGDIVKIHQKIVEGGKERIQIFEGTVIKTSGSSKIDGTFTVRRIASGVGVERTFPLHSPKIVKIERVRGSKVRQSRLYYLRKLTGRKSRLKGVAVEGETWEETAEKEAIKLGDEAKTKEPEDKEVVEEILEETVKASDKETLETTKPEIKPEDEEKA